MELGLMQSHDDGWRTELKEWIGESTSPIHLIGVGNPVKRDDAAGLEVISTLQRLRGGAGSASLKIHPASSSPERTLAKLASQGERVIVFDAVEARREPGAIVCARLGDTRFGYFATHNIPLRLVPGLSNKSGQICLVGIQPGSLEVGEGLTEPVTTAVERLAEAVTVLAEGKQ